MKRLGIDIGSHYISCVLLDDHQVTHSRYIEHRGNIDYHLQELLQRKDFMGYDRIGVTGNFQEHKKGTVDNFLAMIEGGKFVLPQCRNVLAIGGETFALFMYDEQGQYREHQINPPCASGTGSFIEQQAERLNISVSELAQRAAAYQGVTPAIATRCAVFAKTDIIHAMQEGHSLDAICAGLCEGIARNVLDILVKGRSLESPLGLIGGVALNQKICGALRGLTEKQVSVPEFAEVAGAIGAAVLAQANTFNFALLKGTDSGKKVTRDPLNMHLSNYPSLDDFQMKNKNGVEVMTPFAEVDLSAGAYLGIDIGSTSTKAIIINLNGDIAGGYYTATGGSPIAAVQTILQVINSVCDMGQLTICGVGTTGSGRKMIHTLFNADLEINEITAHARAAHFLNPKADTIIEIGGQDSKFTRLRDGEVYFSTMNYVCAAGTGSFIEEQSKRLGVNLSDFSELALNGKAPYTSDRCTVYMERDLSQLLNDGWSKEALAAAICHSVCDNYLSKVVNKSTLGGHVVFQGATARNKALVTAFEQKLNRPIQVSPFCHLTGALGTALLLKEKGLKQSTFCWDQQTLSLREETCLLCANQCVLTIAENQHTSAAWGMKCGREYGDTKIKKRADSQIEMRFKAVMQPLFELNHTKNKRGEITIGVPKALYNAGYAPLWNHFLTSLGFSVTMSSSKKQALESSKKVVDADFCAPMILAHGYVQELLSKPVDYLFFPAIENEEESSDPGLKGFRLKTKDAYYCYYSQYIPTIVSKLKAMDLNSKMMAPLLSFNQRSLAENAQTIFNEMHSFFADLTLEEVTNAFTRAYALYSDAKRRWRDTYHPPKDVLGKIQIVLLGRPYIVFDKVLNLGIIQKIEALAGEVYWQEEFDLEHFDLTYAETYHERMHWNYGRKILKIAEYCARSTTLFPVYLTSFRCSPDSFLISYVKEIMDHFEKPFLVLQLDEHGSDVGYTTRIEAGLKTFENNLIKKERRKQTFPGPNNFVQTKRASNPEKGDTILLPYIDQVISQLNAACFKGAGFQSMLLESNQKNLNLGYQYVNGGECLPLVEIIGGVIDKVKTQNLDPETCFLYMPTVCMACNFPQFPVLAEMAFNAAGLPGIKVGRINTMSPSEVIPQRLAGKILETNIVGSLIYKMVHRIKPYALDANAVLEVFEQSNRIMEEAILNGRELRKPFKEVVAMFRALKKNETMGRKPRIGVLGDVYVKYNETVNQNMQQVVEELGGELVVTSMTEYPFHFFDVDVRLFGESDRHISILKQIEQRYEKIAAEIIGEQVEPDPQECADLLSEYQIKHYIPGETSINVGRALYFIKHKLVDAIIHVNPMFCCPGVVSSSILKKIQSDFDLPIIDIFYDGTGNPNRVMIPHLHYLKKNYQMANFHSDISITRYSSF